MIHTQRNPKDFSLELIEMKKVLSEIIQKYSKISDDRFIRGEYAEWHLNGLMYHAETIIKQYSAVSEELLLRLNTVKEADFFIMHTPQLQNLMYEFYAFVSLARITLDNLKHILFPLFVTPVRQMPKSITGLESGTTNCPTYQRIAETPELDYMIDLRNCLVHYRTFGINSNSVIKSEDAEEIDIDKFKIWTHAMGKGVFRITEKNNIVFNVFLPDKIFDKNEGKTLANFTYNDRINIIGETMRFLRHLLFNYMEAFALNIHSQEKRFIFQKQGGITPVEYRKIIF